MLGEHIEYIESRIRNRSLEVIEADVTEISFLVSVLSLSMLYMVLFVVVWGIDINEGANGVKILLRSVVVVLLSEYVMRMMLEQVRSLGDYTSVVVGYSNHVFKEGPEGLLYMGRAKVVKIESISRAEKRSYAGHKQDMGILSIEYVTGETSRYVCRGLKGYEGIELKRNSKREAEDIYRLVSEVEPRERR